MPRTIGRGLIGVSLCIGLLALGCLKFPLGNPETSRVDPALTGIWFERSEDGSVALWSVRPFDSRAYLVVLHAAKPDPAGGWTPDEMSIQKAWLTEIGGKRFVTMQDMEQLEESEAPYVIVKVEGSGDTLNVAGINPEYFKASPPASAEEFAATVERNVDDPKLYMDPRILERTGEADAETVAAILKAFK